MAAECTRPVRATVGQVESGSSRCARLDQHLLDLGDPEAGDPIQCDELRIEHDQAAVEIVGCNRAILLFTTDSEAVRVIHQVCCRLA